jgi:hypothetical protein
MAYRRAEVALFVDCYSSIRRKHRDIGMAPAVSRAIAFAARFGERVK